MDSAQQNQVDLQETITRYFNAIIKPTDSRKSTYVIHGGARCRTAIHYESKWSFKPRYNTCSGCDKIVTTDYNNDFNYTTVNI